jgi:hypothetical protein
MYWPTIGNCKIYWTWPENISAVAGRLSSSASVGLLHCFLGNGFASCYYASQALLILLPRPGRTTNSGSGRVRLPFPSTPAIYAIYGLGGQNHLSLGRRFSGHISWEQLLSFFLTIGRKMALCTHCSASSPPPPIPSKLVHYHSSSSLFETQPRAWFVKRLQGGPILCKEIRLSFHHCLSSWVDADSLIISLVTATRKVYIPVYYLVCAWREKCSL